MRNEIENEKKKRIFQNRKLAGDVKIFKAKLFVEIADLDWFFKFGESGEAHSSKFTSYFKTKMFLAAQALRVHLWTSEAKKHTNLFSPNLKDFV